MQIQMIEQSYINSIKEKGSLVTACSIYGKVQRSFEKSTEDYIGNITAVFLPYMNQNISDVKFMHIQEKLRKIVAEIKIKQT